MALRCSNVATHMKKETKNQIDDCVREVFEPRYGRRLSDGEIREIRTNLMAYAEWLVRVAGRIYRETGSLPGGEDRTKDV